MMSLMTLNQYKNQKLINRIPGSRVLISSLPSLSMSTSDLKALPGKHDIKRHSPGILYIAVSEHIIIILIVALA